MDFKQLQVVWRAQEKAPLYAIDEAELHAVVRRRNAEFTRCQTRRYWNEIAGGFVFAVIIWAFAVVLTADPAGVFLGPKWVRTTPTAWDIAALAASGGLLFYYAGYMYFAQRRQQQRERDFAQTLRGEIERSIDRTVFLTRIAEGILWRGLVPQWIAAALWVGTMFRLLGAEPLHYGGAIAAMLVALAFAIRCEQRRIARRFEPRRRELEALRQKLVP